VERLLGTDLLFSCALITEGLFSKSQKVFLSSSSAAAAAANYDVFVYPEKHNSENEILARAIMLQMEINYAAKATSNVVYLDGSLITALIHMYKAVNMIKGDESFVSSKIKENFEEFLISCTISYIDLSA
jgi:hypothetical protein